MAVAGCTADRASTREETTEGDLIGGVVGQAGASMYLATGCTATRVGEQHILTAAHCVFSGGVLRREYDQNGEFGYATGAVLTSAPRRNAHVMKLLFGQEYAAHGAGPDWALIVTREGLGDDVPIAMVDLDPVNANEQVLLTGYGCTERYDQPSRDVRDFQLGYTYVMSTDDDYLFTAGTAGGGFAGLCPGDSGGPVYRAGAIVGINASAWTNRDRVTTKSGHTRVDGATDVGRELEAAGVSTCHSSRGTCTSQEPKWIAGKLTVFDKCIAPSNGGTENATPITLVPCTDDRNQRWTVRPDRTIVHEVSGRCFDMAEPAAGAPFHLWDCHRQGNQLFSSGDGGTILVDTGFCVDAAGGSSEAGTPLIGWSCHGQPNQQIGYWF